jgi:ubiquinone/menaquinone biosynthesis C-methylase UbiE
MFAGHYNTWRESRINGLQKYISPSFFKGKTLLELGCGYADIGIEFDKLGAKVTCSDARKEHLDIVNQRYPHLGTVLIDADNMNGLENYDIILHWGLLYHLNEIEQHLAKIAKHCHVLLLETEIADSNDPDFYIKVQEDGYDQAFNKFGIRPSPAYVEKILTQNGFKYKRIEDPVVNSQYHFYDTEITNTNTWKSRLRKFWICWKTDEPA